MMTVYSQEEQEKLPEGFSLEHPPSGAGRTAVADPTKEPIAPQALEGE
jgi:hypothetical protein